jgi:hypothetical protein
LETIGTRFNLLRRKKGKKGMLLLCYILVAVIAVLSDTAHAQVADTGSIEKYLSTLNEESVKVEQAGGDEARKYFEKLLSDQLIFRRATGKVVGKAEFIEGLKKSSPFSSRSSGIVSVTSLNDRALVTLIVVATRADDGSVHHYRNIRLFSRSGQDWLMELWYNYEITGL